MIPKLSIIVPCFNCKSTLRQAVDSCFSQGLTEPFEIILVDDMSTDDTKVVMQNLATIHPEIQLFYHERNEGGGATRNTAVEKTRGEILFCLDSDDVLPKDTMSIMLKYINEKNCDGVSIHRSVKFIGNDIYNINHVDVSPYVDREIPFESLLSANNGFQPLLVNFMYTKSGYYKAGGYPTSHGYDTQGFAWRFMCAGLSAYTCPNAEYLHRIKFNKSYFRREYDEGKINYNWRDILLEHYYVFSDEALHLICTFDCKDFTRNIMDELAGITNNLRPDFRDRLGKSHPPIQIYLPEPAYVRRNNMLGYYLRIKHRLKKLLNSGS